MSVDQFLSSLFGQWAGTYKLWLDPNADPAVSESSLVVKPTANNAYVLIHYDWVFKGGDKAGLFLLGGKGSRAQATWGDSFHMEPLPMICDGEMVEDRLILNGTYPAGDETWGWRTELSLGSGGSQDRALVMRAFNIAPTGEEAIALEAIYQAHGQ